QCINNLKQITLGAHNFHSTFKRFPPGHEVLGPEEDAQGYPDGSGDPQAVNGFLTLLLPYLDQVNIENNYDYLFGFDNPVNTLAVTQEVATFLCPSAAGSNRQAPLINFREPALTAMNEGRTGGATDYTGIRIYFQNWGADGRSTGLFDRAFERDGGLAFRDIRDGTVNTLMLVEKAGMPDYYILGRQVDYSSDAAFNSSWPYIFQGGPVWYFGPWSGFMGDNLFSMGVNADLSSQGADSCYINCNNTSTPYSFHPGGVNISLADGSARFISETIDPLTYRFLIDPQDGQVLGDF
ncbi:MAG: DUF1559 domain-containing protein, partial [Planctomycetota bacterium]